MTVAVTLSDTSLLAAFLKQLGITHAKEYSFACILGEHYDGAELRRGRLSICTDQHAFARRDGQLLLVLKSECLRERVVELGAAADHLVDGYPFLVLGADPGAKFDIVKAPRISFDLRFEPENHLSMECAA